MRRSRRKELGALLALFVGACGTDQLVTSPPSSPLVTATPAARPPVKHVPELAPTFLPAGSHLSVRPTYVNDGMRFLAVGRDGTAYAVRNVSSRQLYASSDGARTWTRRGPEHRDDFRVMTVLSSGTLLADTLRTSGSHVLVRSDDEGRTWTPVLELGPMLLLTPHSVDELDGEVFVAEYQAFTNQSVPVHVWASADDGRTWEQRATFTDRRHAHGLRTDPAHHAVWIFFGDNEERTGMVRSTDGGRTFEKVLLGGNGSAVDGVFTERGLLFGQDLLYASHPGALMAYGDGAAPRPIVTIPGPSYSLHPTPAGGLVLGTTREPTGNTYSDDSAHLLASADGVTWDDVLQFPRISPTEYARANVYWTLPTGELVLQLTGVTATGGADGYELLAVTAQKP